VDEDRDYPLGSFDIVKWVEGDKDIMGRVYVGFSGSGFAYKTNYLLMRDLYGGNDNGPMWLDAWSEDRRVIEQICGEPACGLEPCIAL